MRWINIGDKELPRVGYQLTSCNLLNSYVLMFLVDQHRFRGGNYILLLKFNKLLINPLSVSPATSTYIHFSSLASKKMFTLKSSGVLQNSLNLTRRNSFVLVNSKMMINKTGNYISSGKI